MAKRKPKSSADPQDEPTINIVDRRSSISEEDDKESNSDIEERLPSYVERLKQEAEEKDKRLREYISAYKEKSGENDDFRKRLEKDNDVRLDQFKANLFSRLVPILDNLSRAIQTSGSNKDFDGLYLGVEMVAKQFARELKNNEVTIIDTKNRKFNPKTDEVVMTEDTPDPEQDNTIVQELEPGYIFKDKLIKAAKVKVAHLKT
ncbi:MAG: nucleotide exchange factor GrpE [Nitrospina sp.]|jgi:molecular chaperone GrpE|nr:nucleotide exchange factor GrpE [Nitrospina sp.]MBT3508209.1 nucleotide exchange factor GrpE [Nitrospina sp.]MBT3875580.1 nucleotide exchange factor GrpE [Nitrospina sp.]MBT4048026.1 nucleotide exchange factor GrpE [Nitrospina sp.]MBT4555985.1 nucleotide exchange factor GrpE [Nitrospina sp.]